MIQTFNFRILKASIAEMSTWIHSYISSQDGLECVNSDIRVHSVFYTICQTLFYVIAFRHSDFVHTKKSKWSDKILMSHIEFRLLLCHQWTENLIIVHIWFMLLVLVCACNICCIFRQHSAVSDKLPLLKGCAIPWTRSRGWLNLVSEIKRPSNTTYC
jgi:hypothetical protein